MPRKYKITVAPKADAMFAMHVEFLERVSHNAARKLMSSYKKSVGRIAKNPSQFPFADTIDISNIPLNIYRKCLFEDRYKIIFRTYEAEVLIVTILDSRSENQSI